MPSLWIALKKSLNCKSEGSCDVLDHGKPHRANGINPSSSSICRSGCSRSIANLRDVIQSHGGSRRQERQALGPGGGCSSPRSIGSNDIMNAVTHDVLLAAGPDRSELRISTPGRPWAGGGFPFTHSPLLLRCSTTPVSLRKSTPSTSPLRLHDEEEEDVNTPAPTHTPGRASCEVGVRCYRCGDRFANADSLESHHLSNHAVTELVEGDSSRKVVEIICKAGWPKSENALGRIERVLKVHNLERSAVRFEEFRESVKSRGAKLPKKHPRCLADGNELLRFHGTTVACSLGAGESSSLCTSAECNVCRIIRNGFSAAAREAKNGVGVFTTSTSKRALECIQEAEAADQDKTRVKKALLVCRVIAGRIHKPLENLQDFAAQPGFDSVAGKVGVYSSIEELYLLNPRALLPCFVVICKS